MVCALLIMLVGNFCQDKCGSEDWKPFSWVFCQVFLYDTSWKFLDCRFLSKAEEVSPGKMMEFPGHLVEVGNHEVNRESLRDLKHVETASVLFTNSICKSSGIMLLLLTLLQKEKKRTDSSE
ncbi:uncharacterized protein LOC120293497 [Eucalyptus grandis]|uniref:uncharacterized protein LOC120293497 n=1 Tax=Eucalyptus grandis TaxID=71139 RepID=UPI00192E9A25|nr:uncharacterized protein LOC120293497 [Eucalyptus grandis]